MQLEITYIRIIHVVGREDKIYLHTQLPTSFPELEIGYLVLEFDAPENGGAAYIRTHFGVDPETTVKGDDEDEHWQEGIQIVNT